MNLAICAKCGTAVTCPEGYTERRPWLAAHAKTCPGGGTPKVVAKVKRKRKGRKATAPDPVPLEPDFVEESTRAVVNLGAQALVDALFKKR